MELWNKKHNFISVGGNPQFSPLALGFAPLLQDLLAKKEGHVSECAEQGNTKEDEEFYIKKMEELKGRVIHKHIGDGFSSWIWLWEDSVVELEFSGDDYIRFKGLSKNEKFLTDIKEFVTATFYPSIRQGFIFAIVYSGNKLSLSNIGNAGITAVRQNYTSKVLEDYDYIVKELNSKYPAGRIVILEGEPGTGKTHLIRGMLLEVPDAMFVLISPDMVSSLTGPELLPLLLSHKQSYCPNGPIVIVLEDADKCLVNRGADNIGSIQSLLNLGDGILGSLLDLRIVATTNAKKLEMEGALMRPGRLSRRIEVGALDIETASKVFKSLLPEIEVPVKISGAKHKTLAEVYSIAREHGWTPAPREKDTKIDSIGVDPDYDD